MKRGARDKRDGSGDLKTALFLNLGFTVFEIVGGFLTNSLAIISDALHDLGDSLALWYRASVSFHQEFLQLAEAAAIPKVRHFVIPPGLENSFDKLTAEEYIQRNMNAGGSSVGSS